ncbi:MAG: hypothetical protein AABX70_07120, partial [Nanoarchaeota archaeon]
MKKTFTFNQAISLKAAKAEAAFRSEARIQKGVNFTESAWNAYLNGALSQDLREEASAFNVPPYTVFGRGCVALHKLAAPALEGSLRLERKRFFKHVDNTYDKMLFDDEILRIFLAQFSVNQRASPEAAEILGQLERNLPTLSTRAYDKLCVVLKPYDSDLKQAIDGLVSCDMLHDLARDTVKGYAQESALGRAGDFLARNTWAQRIQ